MRPRRAAAAARLAALLALLVPAGALAALPESALPAFSGRGLPLLWAAPFAGLILSIALLPLLAAPFWHRHYGKVAALWAAAFLVPFALAFGIDAAAREVLHALATDYLPFIVVLFALYTVAGGIGVRGGLNGRPFDNTALLAAGTALASAMGTTGAAMLLVRPLLAANAGRRHRVHVVVFFILLVGNVGGALSPLGDPPLFIGFLKGIDFFWPTRHLFAPTLLLAIALLGLFYAVDARLSRGEIRPAPKGPLHVDGKRNFPLLAGVVGAVLLSGVWDSGISIDILGTPLALENVARDALLIGLALVSLAITPRAVREANAFGWAPMLEVAKLFVAIFLTITPIIAMLQAGPEGSLAQVVAMVRDRATGEPNNAMLFWLTGMLSAFLDNAPTYLVFFNLASGDPAALMGPLASTLLAISAGAVYFGALTYVGNAPNFMIKAIAEGRDVAMPSFFGYFGIAGVIMLPLLAVIGWLFV